MNHTHDVCQRKKIIIQKSHMKWNLRLWNTELQSLHKQRSPHPVT